MMRYEMNQSPSQRIHEIVRAIPDGEISATARKGGLSVRYLMKMRGEVVNIGADSLAKLCIGLERSADDLLGLKPPNPAAIAAEKAKREEEADAEFQADLLRGLEQIRARIAKGPKGARR